MKMCISQNKRERDCAAQNWFCGTLLSIGGEPKKGRKSSLDSEGLKYLLSVFAVSWS